MPNHTYHSMQISGDEKCLEDFVTKHFDNENFNFNSIIPMPVELEDTTSPPKEPNPELVAKHGADNWYDWKIKNWGTKWNAYECSLITDKESIEASFQTAWNTPMPIFEKLGKLYPELTFMLQIVDEGGYFGGTVDIVKGDVIEDLTEDKWKEYATELLGWVDDEEENLRLLAMETINGLMSSQPQQATDNTMRQAMARYIRNNMDDFIETIL